MVRDRTDALLVVGTREHLAHRQLIAGLAIEAGLPSMNPYRESATAGGLMAYAPDDVALFRGAASYVDRILRGANPAEMPFQQPTKFELIVNLKTARALGLDVPAALLERADELIE